MKNIVLCSDGTGNKGGYGADTNVYKTYKAVNIHDALDPAGAPLEQITFYDQGVGTDKSANSRNKYRTAVSGAFGFGFEANVKHLYHFLARTYVAGDRVFLFGFSRGAATVRAFAGFLHACGLVDRNHPSVLSDGRFDEDKFRARVDAAFDCYRSKDAQRCSEFKLEYALQDGASAPDGNLRIHFIGVWETVSALGFPQDFSVVVEWFFKTADLVSDRIWPHRFYDYDLNDSIVYAYQALAIDDERITFYPKIWDETHREGHVEQVWFAGAHSNVGGGYPRTGMSDVALDWMMTKAEAHGLVFFDDLRQQVRQGADVHDRLYDSRDGFAMYYRYGPRDLKALCQGRLRGGIALHESAYRKIKALSDAYAPDGLPAEFDVVDTGGGARRIAVPEAARAARDGLKQQSRRLIAARAMLYRVFVELTMAILVISGLLWWSAPDSIVALKQGGGFLHSIAALLSYVTPVYFENFIYAVVVKIPFIFPLMLATLVVLNGKRSVYVDELDEVSRRMCELLQPDQAGQASGSNRT